MVKVASFNIYNRPWERKERLQTALATLKEISPDIIALQEVAQGWLLPNDPIEIFAEGLGYTPYFRRHWHETNLGIFKTGVAVLSRYPITASEYHDFKDYTFWDTKGYQWLRIETPSGPLQVINVHAASTENSKVRESEFTELAQFIADKAGSESTPVLIMGDFNTPYEAPAFQMMVKRLGLKSLYDRFAPNRPSNTWTDNYKDDCNSPNGARLDYMMLLPGRGSFMDGEIHVPGPTHVPHPSDHCPVVGEIKLR